MSSQTVPPPVKPGPVNRLRGQLVQRPNDGKLLYQLGKAYAERQEFGWALAFLCQAVAAEQKNPAYYAALGDALHRHGKYLEAICAFRQALALDGSLAVAFNGMGLAQNAVGELELATASLQVATRINQDNAAFWGSLATVLIGRHEYKQAYAAARKSWLLDDQPELAYINLAEAEFGRGRINAGLNWIRRGLRKNPDLANGYHNMGRGLLAQGQCRRALKYYHQAIARFPKHADAHFGLSNTLLAMGDFPAGWEKYEWRLKLTSFTKSMAGNFVQDLTEPMWAGESLEGKTLLVYGEQGFGDTLQSIRFLPEVAARGCRVILMVYRELVSLLRPLPCIATIIAYGDLIPRYDYHIPVFSLPKMLGKTIATIPCDLPYVPVPNHRRRPELIRKSSAFRVGIFWATKRLSAFDHRSVPLRFLTPLFDGAAVEFFSFQINEAAGELQPYAHLPNVKNLKSFIKDWRDTAFFISQMDLMITIDSGIAHLAGALGAPVWVMLPENAEWRWLAVAPGSPWFDKSPWYPTMRLFRSPAHDAWATVVDRVKSELLLAAANPAGFSQQYSSLVKSVSRVPPADPGPASSRRPSPPANGHPATRDGMAFPGHR